MRGPLRIAVTPGEPAGIGPDLVLMLAQTERPWELVVCADRKLLADRANELDLSVELRDFAPGDPPRGDAPKSLCVHHVPLGADVKAGVLNPANAGYVLACLDVAVNGCQLGDFSAMVTGPVHKGNINDGGHAFSGHTEYIAASTRSEPVMMLVAQSLRVALATTHLPLREVPDAITHSGLVKCLQIIAQDLKERFGIEAPRILVSGLNPHAGEGGHLGSEDDTIIAPAIADCVNQGINVSGPLPADTLFTPKYLKQADVVLTMYHDQGLPVLKHAGFGEAVNVTLGLPIIRTSVDHGTAIDLAASGQIDAGSFAAAIELAVALSMHTH